LTTKDMSQAARSIIAIVSILSSNNKSTMRHVLGIARGGTQK
jgi:hypothetical protein